MSPTWYDLLGVERDATADEIRAAWKAQVADLDPTDRRFGALSEAAAVLLDAERRRQYDATLPAEPVGRAASASERVETPAAPGRRPPAGWLLAVLAVVAVLSVALAAYAWSRPNPKAIEDDARDAQAAAESAVVDVLSYDYRTLADDERDATARLTERYRKDAYDKVWDTIARNAPGTQSVVTTTVVGSSLVRAAEGRVEVLVLVDRPTTNKEIAADGGQPVVYEDHVTVTLVRSSDGDWLIDDMTT
ncbi:MAG TPA: DnaJ domain-containing protein [Nocardioides sp.]|uniref:J domain-containing protein n=1 Tax=Nocardioides sp. TaxID=35761 RepID=UPI002ED90E6A